LRLFGGKIKTDFGEEGKTTADKYMRLLAKQKVVNALLKMPHNSFGGPGIGSTPESVKRRDSTPIPESFNASEKFEYCSSVISTITDQKSCGSCWAMATAGVLSDRACINNISMVQYSPQYMMSCYENQAGCEGGFIGTVWKDIIKYGTVTEECDPFRAEDRPCPNMCQNGTVITEESKVKPVRFYSPWGKTDKERVEAIQREIMENGPVSTAFLVFSRFSRVHHSVYWRLPSETLSGGHMVRIIGWGNQDGIDYWLVANSWGTEWNENGFFKIRRGTNECNIENNVIAGLFK